MPRKPKGVHGRPENAGVHNLKAEYIEKNTEKEDTGLADLLPIYHKGFENRQNYKGLWTEEQLMYEINAYFMYCAERNVKVAKVGLSLWLGISKQQLFDWVGNSSKYGFKSDLAKQAFEVIELSYVGRAEKFPTANLFLLKATHGYNDVQKIEINNTNNTNVDQVADKIKELGLDK